MAFFLKAKRLDFSTGTNMAVVIREDEALNFGINPGDRIEIRWQKKTTVANVTTTKSRVDKGEIGLFSETWTKTKIRNNEIIYLDLFDRPTSIKAIKKKLRGRSLNYHEMYTIIRDLLDGQISNTELSFFIASSFIKDFTNAELYYLTKAMVDTGETVDFPAKKVVDKHCIGGLPGNRTSMIVIPIIASLGLYIPKTSSRAVTSPAGTADTMEILAPVKFNLKEVKKMVDKNNACLIWGGATNIAPADDIIIKLTKEISIEPLDKMIVSIMAKKVAMGIKYLVIDIPVGPTAKIQEMAVAQKVAGQFRHLAKRFGIKTKIIILKAYEPIGRGIGPALEARDVLRVLQQKEKRPVDLEEKSLFLAGALLELCEEAKSGEGIKKAREALISGEAWKKMQDIIKIQGGNQNIDSEAITMGAERVRIYSPKRGTITAVDNRAIDEVARSLGAPFDKLAGIRLHQKIGNHIERGEKLLTFFARNKERIRLAKKALSGVIIFTIR